jgi:hypothetical protein
MTAIRQANTVTSQATRAKSTGLFSPRRRRLALQADLPAPCGALQEIAWPEPPKPVNTEDSGPLTPRKLRESALTGPL